MTERKRIDEADLGELAVMANKYHNDAENAGQSMLLAAWSAGQALLNAKVLCAHGDWITWLEANFDGSIRRAQEYMQIAANTRDSAHLELGGSVDAALEVIREQNTPAASAKTKRGKSIETTSGQKFAKRYNTFTDDLSFIIDAAEKDQEFAAAAYEGLEHLTRQRDDLTKFIKRLRAKFVQR